MTESIGARARRSRWRAGAGAGENQVTGLAEASARAERG